jgi:uracil-DNA glycosylase
MTVRQTFDITAADPSWHSCINQALLDMDPCYLEALYNTTDWLPGHHKIFNAFSLPLAQTRFVLFGESPYPRATSANGYAFWDAAVDTLWSGSGLSKPVNRATSLRNIIKMLLVAEGKLNPHETNQNEISKICKNNLVKTNSELFNNFLSHGFLLLNTTPVLREGQMQKDARAWHPFMKHILSFILKNKPDIQLVLLGNVANAIEKLVCDQNPCRLTAEHPYNLSFIQNPEIIQFFSPLHLLRMTRYP